MEYGIESVWSEQADQAIESLERRVQQKIQDGWMPFGAPSLVFTPCDQTRFSGVDGFTAIQAVRRLDTK